MPVGRTEARWPPVPVQRLAVRCASELSLWFQPSVLFVGFLKKVFLKEK